MDNNIIIEDRNVRISFMDFVNSLKSFFIASSDIEQTQLDGKIKLIEDETDLSHIKDLEKYVTAYKSAKKATKCANKKQNVQINGEREKYFNKRDGAINSKQLGKNEDNELSL